MNLKHVKALAAIASTAGAIVKCNGKERFWIVLDDHPSNPIEGAIGRFFSAHKDFSFGHQSFTSGSECTEAAESYAGEDGKVIPVYMLDHSTISFSINNFRDPWDSGQIGYWAFDADDLRELGDCSPEHYVYDMLKGYQNYVNGWIYAIFDVEKEEIVCGDLMPEDVRDENSLMELVRDYVEEGATIEVEEV